MNRKNGSPEIGLVISDIDGTLLTSNHELTRSAKKAAKRLVDSGIKLALASSRPPRAIRPIAECLNLDVPFGAFNGSLIAAEGGLRIIAESTITPSVTKSVKGIASELGLDVWLYDAVDWWASERTAFVDREEHTAGFKAVLKGYDERLAAPLNKLTVVGLPDRVAAAEQQVLKDLGSLVSASRSKPRFLDITPYGWHKGSVVARFANLFDVPDERIATIGDGPNDVEMFSCSGMSIAMGQAVEAVSSRAQFVTATNDEEGWALAMTRYVLGKGAE